MPPKVATFLRLTLPTLQNRSNVVFQPFRGGPIVPTTLAARGQPPIYSGNRVGLYPSIEMFILKRETT